MLKKILATTAIAVATAGFVTLSPPAAWAEPEPSAVGPELKPSPGTVVLLQYSYAPCGNGRVTTD